MTESEKHCQKLRDLYRMSLLRSETIRVPLGMIVKTPAYARQRVHLDEWFVMRLVRTWLRSGRSPVGQAPAIVLVMPEANDMSRVIEMNYPAQPRTTLCTLFTGCDSGP